jgi:molybdate transport system regulatory protein
MKLRVRVMLENKHGEPFMGIGLLQLLEHINKKASVTQAARAMRLSYVKALRILDRLEQNLGVAVVERQKGGSQHGGARLTAAGQKLIRDFRVLYRRVDRAANAAFRDFSQTHKPRRNAR